MSQGNKFPFKKILEFTIREETSIKAMFAFFKAMEDYEKKNIDIINEMGKDIQQACSQFKNQQLTKLISNFSIHPLERNHSQANLALINEKLNFWLDGALDKLKGLQEKAKRMESNKQNLTAKDIGDFKTELLEETLQLNRMKESILNLYCHNMIKNNCNQLEELTNKMAIELARKNLPPSNMMNKK